MVADYRAVFDRRGRPYDDAMSAWPAVRAEEFAFVLGLADLAAGHRVLDVPCGGGYLAGLVPAGVEIVGVDPTLAFATAAAGRGATTVVASPAQLPLGPGSFDRVLSIAGVHHEPDLGALVAAWRAVLAPGGRLVLADVAVGSPEAAFLDGPVGAMNGEGHAGTYLDGDLGAIVERAGLRVEEVRDGRYHWWARSEPELVGFCRTLFALDEPDDAVIAAALRAGPGLTEVDGRCGLRWGLRAVVATAP